MLYASVCCALQAQSYVVLYPIVVFFRFSSADVMRAHLLTFEALLMEEECQINGVTYIFDEDGVNLSHVGMWTPSDVTRAFKCSEKAIPLRHRQINFVNMPWSMYLIFQFAKNLLSYKLR